ncbi:hypothetical protein ACKC9G_03945 [Pokkaliibacter sp. CJK22405]|uniref:hypothetical protein n=1 Tax=Pokkaliibacter sp. CJK22405 TaxID=3384615 RepID=UPI00398568DB
MALNAHDAQQWVDSLGPRPDPVKVAKATMAIEKKLTAQGQQLSEADHEEAQSALQVLTAALYETEWSEEEQAAIAALAPANTEAQAGAKPASQAQVPQRPAGASAPIVPERDPILPMEPAPGSEEEKRARFNALRQRLGQ